VAQKYFNAYIDEAGDEGFKNPAQVGPGTSSEWLVLAAVIVPAEDDLVRSRAVDSLRALLNKPPPKPLHFRFLKQHSKKRAAMAALAQEPFVFSTVAIWKPGITSGYLQQAPHLYNYAARFLIERLSWYADDQGRQLNLYFENRASTSYTALQGYMNWIQNDPACSIRNNTIASFKPVASTVKLAQIADFYASATHSALEPDAYGHPTPDYLEQVTHQLYRRGGNITSYGFVVFPPQGADHNRYPWMAKL
jgi:hypothetical protein